MIDWAFAPDEVPAGLECAAALVLPAFRVQALPPLTREQLADAASSGGPGVLRRQALAALAMQALGIAPRSVRLCIGPGQRRVLGGTAIFASVACRAGWVAAVLARAPVGIDLETIGEGNAAAAVALADFDGGEDGLAAWHGPAGVWAAKEAALKAGGNDLTTPIARWRFGDGTIGDGRGPARRVGFAAIDDIIAAVVIG